jgi:hypothetical protein
MKGTDSPYNNRIDPSAGRPCGSSERYSAPKIPNDEAWQLNVKFYQQL